MTAKDVQVGWGPCCFCGGEIEKNAVDPARVTVETVSGKWQVWVCHAGCFKLLLIKDSPVDLSPAHF